MKLETKFRQIVWRGDDVGDSKSDIFDDVN